LSHRSEGRLDETIVSLANPLIKHVRSLQRRRTRHQERAFVVEGLRAVDDALSADARIQTVLVRDDIPSHRVDPRLHQFPIRTVSDAVFKSVSNVDVPQGILVVVSMHDWDDLASWQGRTSLALIADGIRDPGNLGTLLRSAAAAGADFVAMADESVDPYNPKVVRAAMGAHFHVPLYQASEDHLNEALSAVDQVVIAEAAGDVDYDQVDFARSTAIVVGGEAFGPLGHLQHRNLITARIPLERDIESLNAGVAGSLLLFEAARQRRQQP
jgi:TrmH family RNA methyltransferase